MFFMNYDPHDRFFFLNTGLVASLERMGLVVCFQNNLSSSLYTWCMIYIKDAVMSASFVSSRGRNIGSVLVVLRVHIGSFNWH